jgi:phytoene desaturase
VVTAPQLFEELWEIAGKRLADDIELVPVNPFYSIRFHDGTVLAYTGDADAMRAQIASLRPEDVEGYDAYMEMSRKIFEVGFKRLADVPFSSWTSMARIVPEMLKLKSYRTVYGLVSSFVKNEKLRQVLSFHTLLVGGNPFTTSSIYSLISYLERKWGVHYAMGGTGKLVHGMVGLVKYLGGEVLLGREVRRITFKDRRATGVELTNGEAIAADLVVSNADSAWTYRKLIPTNLRRRWTDKRLANLKYSMSLFVWCFGTRKQYHDVNHHTILLGPRYKGLLDDIFHNLKLAEDFSLYLHRPTATDPSMAPEGHDAFYVLSPVPHLGSGTNWAEEQERYRKSISDHLARTILPGLEDHLVTSRVLTPQGFRDDLLSMHGSAFGMQPLLTQSAYFRPHNESEELEGLYIVGAGTHPGAGLPGVLSSAKLLDRVIPDARTSTTRRAA